MYHLSTSPFSKFLCSLSEETEIGIIINKKLPISFFLRYIVRIIISKSKFLSGCYGQRDRAFLKVTNF